MRAAKQNQIVMYNTENGDTKLEVIYENETVWLNQSQMAELFQSDQSNIARHIQNIYQSSELDETNTMQKMHSVPSSKKPVQYYNLDIIIAVGYRVNSRRGTQFRIWATKRLREFVQKGFIMDDDRLANGGSGYFDELVKRVRSIRTSEYNFYKKIREIFSTSADYDKDSPEAKTFFASVQNKFHYAIHEHTAAELIVERVGSDKYNLGLTNWRNGVFKLEEAFIAKNYLKETELKRLELLVEQFLTFAELRYYEHHQMFMKDWIRKIDQFIGELNEKPVLTHAGFISNKTMEATVRKAYEEYRNRMIAEEALTANEWKQRELDAYQHMLLPPEEDTGLMGLDSEVYNERARQLSSKSYGRTTYDIATDYNYYDIENSDEDEMTRGKFMDSLRKVSRLEDSDD